MSLPPLLLGLMAALGACIGSLTVTATMRGARGEGFVHGRSHCDGCGRGLSFAETTPVVSYLALRGACASCGAPITPTHLAGELIGAALPLLAFMLLPFPLATMLTLQGYLLLAAATVDLATMRLPDAFTGAIALVGLSATAFRGAPALVEGAMCAPLIFALLQVVRMGFRRLRGRDGLGFGDVKLTSALAVSCGANISWALAAACIGGLITFRLRRGAEERLPFGPFLAGAGWLWGLAQAALGSSLWT